MNRSSTIIVPRIAAAAICVVLRKWQSRRCRWPRRPEVSLKAPLFARVLSVVLSEYCLACRDCLYALFVIARHAANTTGNPFPTRDVSREVGHDAVTVLDYIVNIGYTKKWGYRPMFAVLISLGELAVGVFSFVLAALTTPGCEIRAIATPPHGRKLHASLPAPCSVAASFQPSHSNRYLPRPGRAS